MTKVSEVQKLREMTGAGVMECKKALDEAGGDLSIATEIIRKSGLAKAGKRAGRNADAGMIDAYIHNNRVGVLLELNCETDFVARNDEFKNLSHEISMQIAAMSPLNIEELMAQSYIRDDKKTIEDLVKGAIAKLGENINIGRFERYEI